MAENIMVTGKTESNMERGSFIMRLQDSGKKVYGTTAKELGGVMNLANNNFKFI
jgi:hypothetical protein